MDAWKLFFETRLFGVVGILLNVYCPPTLYITRENLSAEVKLQKKIVLDQIRRIYWLVDYVDCIFVEKRVNFNCHVHWCALSWWNNNELCAPLPTVPNCLNSLSLASKYWYESRLCVTRWDTISLWMIPWQSKKMNIPAVGIWEIILIK